MEMQRSPPVNGEQSWQQRAMRYVRDKSLLHPLTLFPGALAIPGGIAAALFGSVECAAAAGILGVVAGSSFVVNYFFRDQTLASEFVENEKAKERDVYAKLKNETYEADRESRGIVQLEINRLQKVCDGRVDSQVQRLQDAVAGMDNRMATILGYIFPEGSEFTSDNNYILSAAMKLRTGIVRQTKATAEMLKSICAVENSACSVGGSRRRKQSAESEVLKEREEIIARQLEQANSLIDRIAAANNALDLVINLFIESAGGNSYVALSRFMFILEEAREKLGAG